MARPRPLAFVEPDPAQLDEVRKLARRFATATGVACTLLDPQVAANLIPACCSFCRCAADLGLAPRRDCAATHRDAAEQAARFGGRSIYFCAGNLAHWSVPLIIDGEVLAALVCGPVLLTAADEYLDDELPARGALGAEALAELSARLAEIPFVSPERATALTETLYLAVTGLSAQLAGRRPDAATKLAQRSSIAGHIHELKRRSAAVRYPLAKERELLALISKGDKLNSQRVLNEILGHIFFASGSDLAGIRNRVQELVVLLSRAALEGGASAEEVFGLNNDYLSHLHEMHAVDDIAAWLAGILRRFSDCVFALKAAKHADAIQRALHFINARYGSKISVQDVADAAHMSASHFGKVFKEEMGLSLTDYLGRLRVERSKAMLREEAIPLAEVASRAGFDDQSYFSKVFKRHTGQSPGRYRSTRGQAHGAAIEIHE